MPKEAGTTAAAAASSAPASNEDLKSILYPQGGGAASAEDKGSGGDADHDPEFDGDEDQDGADPGADGDDGDGDGAPEGDGKAKASADADGDDDDDADGQDGDGAGDGDDDDDADGDDAGGEDDDDPDADDEDDDEKKLRAKAKFSPDQQKLVDKLLGKKTAQTVALRTEKEKLERRTTALEQEVDELRQGLPPPVATRDNPLADAATEADLATREQNAVKLRYWLMRNRDGGELVTPDGKGGVTKTQISPERRDELLAETDELLMVHLPGRRQFLQQQRVFEAEARKVYPDLKDAKSELSLKVDKVLRAYPALQTMPEAKLFIADVLAQKEARAKGAAAARAAAGGDGAARGGDKSTQSRKAPRTEGAPRVAARVNPDRKRAAGAFDRLEKTGRDEGNVALAQLIRVPRG